MTSSWSNARDLFRSKLWPIPVAFVIAALLVGLGVPALDASVDSRLPSGVGRWLFSGDADAARSLLGTIASSLITVTALTFSLTVVTLQLASSQFSPRLLRTFTSDLFVQNTLALFLGTFTYALTVLRAIGRGGDGEFVPKFAVTLAFVLAVTSVVALVLFLAHLTAQIRVETMLHQVHQEAARTMASVLPERDAEEPVVQVGAAPSPSNGEATTLYTARSGFLTWIDESGLLDVAVEADIVIRLDVDPGSFVVEGTPIGSVWPAAGGGLASKAAREITSRINSRLITGMERTASQDIGFGFRQLTDVANKALSPGVNDPTTAVHALGHISALLCDLTARRLGVAELCDGDGQVRVVLARPDFARFLDLAISQPRHYGASDPQVMASVLKVLQDLTHRAGPEHRDAILAQLERSRTVIERQDFDPTERAALSASIQQIEANLHLP